MDSIDIKATKLTSANLGEQPGAQIESQLNSHADIGRAHKFFAPGAETHAVASLSPIPGSESAALAAIPGAGQPISPLVQMIMRLPGHIGLLNSFFEALQAFFIPHTDLLAGFDPSSLAAHAGEITKNGLTSGLEHGAIDPSILPPESHIFDGLDTASGADLSFKTAWNMNLHNDGVKLFSSDLTVSGQPDVSNTIFEKSTGHTDLSEQNSATAQAGGVLAGPGISQSAVGSHLAGSHPIFSKELFDRAGVQSNSAMLASAPPNATNATVAQNLGSTAQAQTEHALFVSGTPVASQLNPTANLSEVGTNSLNHGATNASFSFVPRSGLDLATQGAGSAQTFGPSGAVSDTLGAKNVLGSNDELASNFHQSTLSGASSNDMVSQQTLTTQSSDATAHAQTPLKGLHAKELSLDGAKPSHSHHETQAQTASSHHKTSHSSSHSNKPTVADSHNSSTIKTHNNSIPSPVAKASPTDNTQATSDNSTEAAIPDQTSLETGSHTVHAGDSLWKVAQERLGDASRWPDIYKLNIDKIGSNPDLIHTGLKLDLPEHAQDIASPTQPSTDYVVKAGDNLWDISKHVYGSGTHWSEIYHVNANVIGNNPSLIFPGEKLSIPSTDASSTLASAPNVPTTSASPAAPDAPATHPEQLADASQTGSTAPATEATSPAATQQTTQVAAQPEAPKLAFSGPGAADAMTVGNNSSTGDASVVSPSLAPDLSFFTRKR